MMVVCCLLYLVQYNLSIKHIRILVIVKILTFIMMATTSVPPRRRLRHARHVRLMILDTRSERRDIGYVVPFYVWNRWKTHVINTVIMYELLTKFCVVDDCVTPNVMYATCNLPALVFRGGGGCTPCRRSCS